METLPVPASSSDKKGLSTGKVLAIVITAMLLTMAMTLLAVRSWLFPGPFKPVTLSQSEEQRLEHKLDQLGSAARYARRSGGETSVDQPVKDLQPEPYREEESARDIQLTEREINGMIAQNTDLASRMAVDFSDNLVSVKLLIPIDHDFPIMGGKTLKVRAGAELAFRNERPIVILRGVSVMGVPLPNAWLGGLKNIDLIREFGADPGFWKGFADGIAAIEVREGTLHIVLKE
ncbi:MAG: arginine N-succinyltransferase [Desulfobulbus sp.]|nr:arginine N-succinyltransferase [Desulfobulbus sp.]